MAGRACAARPLRSVILAGEHGLGLNDRLVNDDDVVLLGAAASSEESEGEGEESEYVEASEEEADTWQAPIGETELSNWQPDYVDVRDDRVVLYGTALRDVGTFVYRVRATNAGTFNTPPAYAEGMYETTLQGRGKVGQLEITKP